MPACLPFQSKSHYTSYSGVERQPRGTQDRWGRESEWNSGLAGCGRLATSREIEQVKYIKDNENLFSHYWRRELQVWKRDIQVNPVGLDWNGWCWCGIPGFQFR